MSVAYGLNFRVLTVICGTSFTDLLKPLTVVAWLWSVLLQKQPLHIINTYLDESLFFKPLVGSVIVSQRGERADLVAESTGTIQTHSHSTLDSRWRSSLVKQWYVFTEIYKSLFIDPGICGRVGVIWDGDSLVYIVYTSGDLSCEMRYLKGLTLEY